jgi:hypothetical protein
MEDRMGDAAVAFTDLGGLAGTSFPETGELEEERLYLESEIRSEYNFEDIVGKSAALRKVLDQVAIVAPTGGRPCSYTVRPAPELVARGIITSVRVASALSFD